MKSINERLFYEILTNTDFIKNKEVATRVYDSLCNHIWYHIPTGTTISYSWRASGSLIASYRYNKYGIKESYLDYYCSGSDGVVSDVVLSFFKENDIVLIPDAYSDTPPLEDKIKLIKRKLKLKDI